MDLFRKSAHMFNSRDGMEEGLESDAIFYNLLEALTVIYGRNVTRKWHYGDSPGSYPTSCHLSNDGLKQGDAPVTVYFDIIATRIYRKQLKVLNNRNFLFAVANDVRIVAHQTVIAEIVDAFASVACNQGDLSTQVVKNKIYVQPSACEGCTQFLESAPRESSAVLPIHDVPDVRHRTDSSDPDNARI